MGEYSEDDIFGAAVTLADPRTARGGLRGLRPVGIPRGMSGECPYQFSCVHPCGLGRGKIPKLVVRARRI